jgi:hypothetical protein
MQIYSVFQNLMSTHNWTGGYFKPLTPELNPSAQRWLKRFFAGDFSS